MQPRSRRCPAILSRYGLPSLALGCVILAAGTAGAAAAALALAAAGATAGAAMLATRRPKASSPPDLGMSDARFTDQMIQSQKLAALGQLATGIAHEINTPLAVIGQEAELMGYALEDAAFADSEDAAPIRAAVGRISAQVERCSEITHSMLELSRRNDPVAQKTDLAALVEDMAALVERSAGRDGIVITRDYAKDMPAVATSSPMLKQVVLNLLVNASQALESGGTIAVAVFPDPEGRAVVSVSDDGPGIPPEHLDEIFNPFFTTKPPGKGTGLGLSVCLGIVDRLGGVITAGGNPDGGATFTVRLPMGDAPRPRTEVQP